MANTLRSKTVTASLPGGCEVVLTLIQPRGVSDAAFDEYVRWAERTMSELKSLPQPDEAPAGAAAEPAGRSSGIWSAMKAVLIPERRENPVAGTSAAEASHTPAASGRKLYVGNLPYAWTDDMLRALFAAQGTVVTAEVARFGRRGGRSRGFGFVEMSTEAEAQTAIEKLHEALAGDRKMIVRLARSREHNGPEGAAPGDAHAASQPAPSRVSRNRSPRPGRGNRPPSRRPSSDSTAPRSGSDRPARQTGISNNSGYEIYPRSTEGEFSSEPTARSSAPPPASSIEASPYMDDTGDVENRGNRPPRRRRR